MPTLRPTRGRLRPDSLGRAGTREGGSPAARILKRAADLYIGATALVALSPLLGSTAVLLLLTQGRPILFRQVRAGRGGRPFRIVKFRTMRLAAAGETGFGADAVRTTSLGRLLRTTSIDELPTLWNVLRGDMSLVGPRPLLIEYLPAYTAEESRRHEVRPGLTGWAVVNGRHARPFKERLRLDVWYVDHWTLGLDLRILALTARQLLGRRDVLATQDVSAIAFPERFAQTLDGAASAVTAIADPPAVGAIASVPPAATRSVPVRHGARRQAR